MNCHPIQRFVNKITFSDSGCWLWTGGRTVRGYGLFWLNGNDVRAHRFAYEEMVGEIPEGMVLDHLCRVTTCVNPSHLEPVTNRENVLRGYGPTAENARRDACRMGHPFSPENTYSRPGLGDRQCRACRLEESRRRFGKSPVSA